MQFTFTRTCNLLSGEHAIYFKEFYFNAIYFTAIYFQGNMQTLWSQYRPTNPGVPAVQSGDVHIVFGPSTQLLRYVWHNDGYGCLVPWPLPCGYIRCCSQCHHRLAICWSHWVSKTANILHIHILLYYYFITYFSSLYLT